MVLGAVLGCIGRGMGCIWGSVHVGLYGVYWGVPVDHVFEGLPQTVTRGGLKLVIMRFLYNLQYLCFSLLDSAGGSYFS